ncbi:MAG: serpin family protein [Chlamydiota bacterium]|nr:serpin family protein [Chlamydiota bacterium]
MQPNLQLLNASNFTPSAHQSIVQPDNRTFAMRMNDFGFKIHREIVKSKEGNALTSSPSAFFSIAMAYLGANGNTLEEMKKTLEMPETKKEIHQSLQVLTENLSDGKVLNIASKIFIANWVELEEDYREELSNVFKTGPEIVNFKETQNAANTINQWAEEKTNSKIKDLVSPNMFNEMTATALVNAVYLLADWKYPFKARDTWKSTFYLNAEKSINTPMMHKTCDFNHYENNDFALIELPYKEKEPKQRSLSMYICLPHENKNLNDIEIQLSSENLLTWIRSTQNRFISLKLPKFAVETTNPLSKALKNLGMKNAFDDNYADFSKITSSDEIKISKVIQKAFLKIDEDGTVATAATETIMARPECATISIHKPTNFHVNKPFIFMIIDNMSETVLFTGKVTNPAE